MALYTGVSFTTITVYEDSSYPGVLADIYEDAGMTMPKDNPFANFGNFEFYADPGKYLMWGDFTSLVGASGFPNAEYLTVTDETADLPNSRVLIAGTGITLDDTTPGELTIESSGGAGTGDVVGPAASVDGEITLYDSTTGKLIKRATGTGFVKVISGVMQAPSTTVALASEVSGDLPLANLEQGTALSVLGVTGNATADNAPIVAGSDKQVLRREGTAVGFGAVDLSAAAAVTGNLPAANLGAIITPQGRLTLTTGVPDMVATVTSATTIYYTPAVGNLVPIFNGTVWIPTAFTELSQVTTDNTKSPAAAANSSNYDLFVWNDAGTIRCTRGPAWTSDTGRGTGAGTTELEFISGILMNAEDITNGPAANRGTYVGSIRTNGSAVVDMIFGGTGAAGGEDTILGIWNMYNRRLVALTNFDNTDTWNYTTATWRVKNADSSNRISFIVGWQGDGLQAVNVASASNATANVFIATGIGLNSETVYTAVGNVRSATTGAYSLFAHLMMVAPRGFNYLAPMEISAASGTTSWFGDNGSTTSNLKALFSMTTMF